MTTVADPPPVLAASGSAEGRAATDALRRRERPARLIVFLLWLGTALFLASRHVVWRDEVRAWTLATTGETVADMLRAVHGEGHPALWYLMLRGFHAVA